MSATSEASSSPKPRIDEVEKEVKKLKTDVENFMELKSTVEELKNTVTDIRALMSETQNPFNFLHLITDDNDLNKIIQARPLLEKKLAKDKAKPQGMDVAALEAKGTENEVGFAVESQVEKSGIDAEAGEDSSERGEDMVDMAESENRLESKEEARDMAGASNMSNANKGIALIHWIYKMLDLGFNEISIRKICDYCEFFCFMPKGYSEHVSNMVEAIIKARSKRLSAEELILSIYSAADAVGVEIDSSSLSKLIPGILDKSKHAH